MYFLYFFLSRILILKVVDVKKSSYLYSEKIIENMISDYYFYNIL